MTRLVLLAGLGMLSLMAISCGPPPELTEPISPLPLPTNGALAGSEQAVRITLWHPWRKDQAQALAQVIRAFQQLQPGVQVEVRYIPWADLRSAYEAAAAIGESPTLLLGAAEWGSSLYDAGWLADLSSIPSEEFLATITPAALAAVMYQDALIGLPQRTEGVVLFRNRSLVTDAPATVEELVAAAQATTQEEVVGAHLERGFFFSAAHLPGIGGELMDGQGNPLFSSEKGVEWVELLRSFEEVGPAEYYTDKDLEHFEDGQVGMIIDWTRNISRLTEAIGMEDLIIDPWPAVGEEGRLSGYVQTENVYLSARAEGEERAAAWEFLAFFLSPEAQMVLSEAGHIPAVIGVELANPLLQQAAVAFEGGTAFPLVPEMGCYWDPMDAALQSVFEEEADPAAALSQANDSIVLCIDEMRGLPSLDGEGGVPGSEGTPGESSGP
jgi:arabinogalactan oligomer/maltooligosaccharide transport system substrate-binding protein